MLDSMLSHLGVNCLSINRCIYACPVKCGIILFDLNFGKSFYSEKCRTNRMISVYHFSVIFLVFKFDYNRYNKHINKMVTVQEIRSKCYYEGGSICNENPFITPSTNSL